VGAYFNEGGAGSPSVRGSARGLEIFYWAAEKKDGGLMNQHVLLIVQNNSFPSDTRMTRVFYRQSALVNQGIFRKKRVKRAGKSKRRGES